MVSPLLTSEIIFALEQFYLKRLMKEILLDGKQPIVDCYDSSPDVTNAASYFKRYFISLFAVKPYKSGFDVKTFEVVTNNSIVALTKCVGD